MDYNNDTLYSELIFIFCQFIFKRPKTRYINTGRVSETLALCSDVRLSFVVVHDIIYLPDAVLLILMLVPCSVKTRPDCKTPDIRSPGTMWYFNISVRWKRYISRLMTNRTK